MPRIAVTEAWEEIANASQKVQPQNQGQFDVVYLVGQTAPPSASFDHGFILSPGEILPQQVGAVYVRARSAQTHSVVYHETVAK